MSFVPVPDIVSSNLLGKIRGDSLTDEDLLRIHAIFGKTTFEALNLLEERTVIRDTAPSGRSIYQVNKKGNSVYCSKSAHFCACMQGTVFEASPLGRLWCSHLLMVALSDALKRTQTNIVSDQALAHAVEMLFKII
ncbi:zinc finger SWIM domain containing protein [Echinococcus multilocularis]|uniref:Zinc finger SWIM domain containing protein n=1 Tax=Echinococcus multilocularis TaxID=6211 RepID=A0A068YD39_ECHMU|nr:zinc finger SWIM domain containing protein [Echinococcus multilocularis]